MVRAALDPLAPVIWRSSFPSEESSAASALSRANSWTRRDEVLRRFSEPAKESDERRLDRSTRSAANAYHDAVLNLRRNLKKDDVDKILSPDSTVSELHKVALSVQREQDDVLDKRKLARFIDVLDHYSGVFDVLSQCDFSYMTVIWGAMKFVIIITKSHQEMLAKFSDMMTEIGLNLSRVELYRHIFPTARMLEIVSELYASIAEFLQEVVIYCRKNTFKKYFAAFSKPFDLQFGRLTHKIRTLQQCIQDDAVAGSVIMQVIQAKGLRRNRVVEVSLQRTHCETSLENLPGGLSSPLFVDVKKTLFHGFEIQASYHEELATIFNVTQGPAWTHWLSVEQKYVPSRFSHETTLVQAECDAPDAGTCLQWVTQARSEYPHVVSAYILWARGMTAQSAIASIMFQMLQQRPQAISQSGLTMPKFTQANSSLPKLWQLFLHLVRTLGGLMVYISIGSVGPEEYSIVKKFVDLCDEWDGPPINITVIHPFDDKFPHVDNCVDLDSAYDVEPVLCCTDALYHVVLMTLNVHERLSDTVRKGLWEALWREVRYSIIGIALNQALEEIQLRAEALVDSQQPPGDVSDESSISPTASPPAMTKPRRTSRTKCTEDEADLWKSSVSKWTKNKRAVNNMREQIQRHLDLVDLHLPEEVKVRLEGQLRRAVRNPLRRDKLAGVTQRLRDGETKPLHDTERDGIWAGIQAAIRPGTRRMFSHAIAGIMDVVFAKYLDEPPETEREARSFVQELQREQFGVNGSWRRSFLTTPESIVDGLVASIEGGFVGVLDSIVGPWY